MNIGKYIEEAKELKNDNAQIVLIGNKCDKDILSKNREEIENFKSKYKIESVRAVSTEYVDSILDFYKNLIDNNIINMIYVSSFQVGDINQSMITHGYIGIQYINTKVIYHITIREKLTRINYIEKIKNIGLNLIFQRNEPMKDRKDLYIDIILSLNQNLTYTIFNYISRESILCWNDKHNLCRAEDIFRDKIKINIFQLFFKNFQKEQLVILRNFLDKIEKIEINIILLDLNKITFSYEIILDIISTICNFGYNCIVSNCNDTKQYFNINFNNIELNFQV